MPTLVTELTPLQRMWLYENQLTRGDSYEERWHTMRSPSFDTTIFRARNFEPTPPSAARKRKHENVPHSKGPRFHYYGDKLTWQQSYENLKVYRDHYGVSWLVLGNRLEQGDSESSLF